MAISICATEEKSREQGFYFAVELILPRYEQFGHVMWSTREEAEGDGKRSVAARDCVAYNVHLCRLRHEVFCALHPEHIGACHDEHI